MGADYARREERGRHFPLPAHAFILIPKTGTSSILAACAASMHSQCRRWNSSIEDSVTQHRVCPLKTARGTCLPSLHHFVDDVAQLQFNSRSLVTLRPSFCVVREPADRWYSARHSGQAIRYDFSLSDDAVASAFARGRFGVGSWTEQLLHMQPQSWFVWDDDGNVTCDCVVAFEKLGQVTEVHVNSGRKASTATPALPKPLQRLYSQDAQLHRAASRAPGLCYRPRSSQPQITQRPETLPDARRQHAMRVLFVLRTGLPSERLRANMLGDVMRQRQASLKDKLGIHSLEVRFLRAPLRTGFLEALTSLENHVGCEGALEPNEALSLKLKALRQWQPNVVTFVKLPPLEPEWQRHFPHALLVVDVVDNLQLIEQLANSAQQRPGGCSFHLALIQTDATRKLLLEATNGSAAMLPQLAIVPHQHTNLGGWRTAAGQSARRPRHVGLLVGSNHQRPRRTVLDHLAEACCSLHLTLLVFFEQQEKASRAGVYGPLTDVTRYQCSSGHYRGDATTSRAVQTPGRLAHVASSHSQFRDSRIFNFSEQSLYNDVGWLQEVDLALLWPGSTDKLVMHRPPTRLLFWMSHGVPALFYPLNSYLEAAASVNYRLPDRSLPSVTSPAHFHTQTAKLLDRPDVRAHMVTEGLRAASEYTPEAVAAKYLAACWRALSKGY